MVEQSYEELPYRLEGEALQERDMNLYWSSGEPILVSFVTYIGRLCDLYRFTRRPILGLLLRVGIKVVDEWQISLVYVRGSNIYVRGYLDLHAWSLRLRA